MITAIFGMRMRALFSKLEHTKLIDNCLLFSSLQEGQHHVKVKINDWSEVNVLMDFNTTSSSNTQVPVPTG